MGTSTFGPSTSSSPTSSYQLSQDRGITSEYASTPTPTSASRGKQAEQAGSSGHEREGGEGKSTGKGKEKIKDFNHFVRSGVAGGIAGCVVRTLSELRSFEVAGTVIKIDWLSGSMDIGQDGRRASR